MLILGRKKDERVIIRVPPSDREQVIVAVVVETRSDKARIGFVAEPDVTINRSEVEGLGD